MKDYLFIAVRPYCADLTILVGNEPDAWDYDELEELHKEVCAMFNLDTEPSRYKEEWRFAYGKGRAHYFRRYGGSICGHVKGTDLLMQHAVPAGDEDKCNVCLDMLAEEERHQQAMREIGKRERP